MNRNDERAEELAPNDNKKAWERPELVRMGRLEDFVHGGGKAGSNMDGDANSSGKPGMG